MEALLGFAANTLNFEQQRESADKYEYSTVLTLGFELGLRGVINLGKLELGAIGVSSWNDMNLLRDFDSGSDNSFNHVYYGGFVGLAFTPSFRLNLEYYASSRIETLWAEPKSVNAFDKGDYIQGTGAGVGFTFLEGNIIKEIMFQAFYPDKSNFDGVSYDSDETYRDFEIRVVSGRLGYRF